MMSDLKPEHDNTSEKFAVDEIFLEEFERKYSRHSPNGLCPGCGVELYHDEQEIDGDLVECIDFCHHCGWESDTYYV